MLYSVLYIQYTNVSFVFITLIPIRPIFQNFRNLCSFQCISHEFVFNCDCCSWVCVCVSHTLYLCETVCLSVSLRILHNFVHKYIFVSLVTNWILCALLGVPNVSPILSHMVSAGVDVLLRMLLDLHLVVQWHLG